MAANKSVTVLVPNGRKQNVKVTPDTTILQVIEQVCRKHQYNADDYDIKHFNKLVDANAILRFTGLPNNAQLEMVPCTKKRKVSNITIGIQLENGERLTGEFLPSTPLLEILKNLCPDVNLDTAVLIYMHREINGVEALESTTLRSLGLSNGRAMLRLIHRDPEQLKFQAHVYVPKAPKPKEPESQDDRPRTSNVPMCHSELDPLSLIKAEKAKWRGSSAPGSAEDSKSVEQTKRIKQSEESAPSAETAAKAKTAESMEVSGVPEAASDKVEFLGERNALVFDQAIAQALPRNDLPDDFFDLTIDDAKILLRDVVRLREDLEDAPLLTDAQRQLSNDKRVLSQLHKYRHTIIRVLFPNQLVLQGVFSPLETVRTIRDFVASYLCEPQSEFTLYTTPPKRILNLDERLIDENLVPSSIIHYSGSSDLKPDIKEKLTDPRIADIEAIKSRSTRDSNLNDTDASTAMEVTSEETQAPGTSGSTSHSSTKVPKWFKPA